MTVLTNLITVNLMWQKYLLLEKLIVGLFIYLFIYLFAFYSSFDTEVVIYNTMYADKAFVTANKA